MSTALVSGVDHISIKPQSHEQLPEAIHFYGDVLGLECVRCLLDAGKDSYANFSAGNTVIEIYGDDTVRTIGPVDHFALKVADCDAVCEIIRAAGYKVIAEPADVDVQPDPVWKVRVAFVEGPCGESIELLQER